MSVVNKMLQDLEDRKAEPAYSADYQPQSSKAVSLRSIFVLIMVLLIAGAVWYYKDALWLYTRSTEQATGLIINAETQQLQPEAKLDKTSKIESNQVDQSELEKKQVVAERQQQANLNQELDNEDAQNLQHTRQQKQVLLAADIELANQIERNQQVADSKSNAELDNQQSTDNIQPMIKQAASEDRTQQDASVSSFEIKSSDKPLNRDELKQQVQLALKRGDNRSAIKLLGLLVEKTPENTSARKRLAAMLFAQGNHAQANDVLEQGINLYPDNTELRIMQARLYEQVKKPMQGFELLLGHPATAYQAPDYIAYRAALAQKVGRFEQAKLDYQQLVRSQSANAKWWLGLAVVEERLGNMMAALDAYQHVKQLSQMSVEVEEFVEQRIRYLAEVK